MGKTSVYTFMIFFQITIFIVYFVMSFPKKKVCVHTSFCFAKLAMSSYLNLRLYDFVFIIFYRISCGRTSYFARIYRLTTLFKKFLQTQVCFPISTFLVL